VKFSIATFISAILAACTFVLWLLTFAITPWDHKISLTKEFHISVWSGFNGDTLGRLVFFNNAQYGPYRGSIMNFGGENTHEVQSGWFYANHHYDFGQITSTNSNGTIDRLKLCDLPGIYFRHFQFHDQANTLWTLMLSLWYPLILFSILPVVWIFSCWRSKRSKLKAKSSSG
jgi:hypothetical protein